MKGSGSWLQLHVRIDLLMMPKNQYRINYMLTWLLIFLFDFNMQHLIINFKNNILSNKIIISCWKNWVFKILKIKTLSNPPEDQCNTKAFYHSLLCPNEKPEEHK